QYDAVGRADDDHGKAHRSSGVSLHIAVAARPLRRNLGLYRGADGGVATRAERLRFRTTVRRMGRTGIERGPVRNAHLGSNADERHVAGKDPATASWSFLLTCGCRRTSASAKNVATSTPAW